MEPASFDQSKALNVDSNRLLRLPERAKACPAPVNLIVI